MYEQLINCQLTKINDACCNLQAAFSEWVLFKAWADLLQKEFVNQICSVSDAELLTDCFDGWSSSTVPTTKERKTTG